MKNLVELRDRVHQINVDNGWHVEQRDIIDDLNLIHSEISEAYEDYRNNNRVNEVWYEYKGFDSKFYNSWTEGESGELILGKPCGIPSELADVVIRVLDTDKLHKLEVVETYNTSKFGTIGLAEFSFSALIYSLHEHIHSGFSPVSKSLAYMIHLIVYFCQRHNINLGQIIEDKLAYNATRGNRHGGKLI